MRTKIRWLLTVIALGCVIHLHRLSAEEGQPTHKRRLDTLWSQFRGPANGRAFLEDAPHPPLKLAWVLNLSDPNGDGKTDDSFFGKNNQTDTIGIAVRADEGYLYLFDVNFYTLANHIFKIHQSDGQLVVTADAGRAEPISNRNSFQLIEAPWGERIAFKGTFYAGIKIFRLDDLKGIPDNRRWEPPVAEMIPLPHPHVFTEYPERSIPAQAWENGKMVMFTRTDFSSPETAVPIFNEHQYTVVDGAGHVLKDVVIDGLYKDDRPSPYDGGADNNVVQAIALSPDSHYLYAHERPTALSQRIVLRNLDDFSIEGSITSLPFYSNGLWFNGKRKDGMAIGFAIDDQHFYLHTQNEVIAYDLTLSKVVWKQKVPPRTLNASVPYWSSYISNDYSKLPNRGTENTIAATDGFIYYTTDTTLEARRTSDGERVWQHVFTDLPTNTLPGDVILTPGYVFVLTHTNQGRLYAFSSSRAVSAESPGK
ncbi:hypothetical protein HYR99_17610 [Candidatus Poribacteria bacterium]|nr:hypothetical protein [Candidatus Poribacteria bacterium]